MMTHLCFIPIGVKMLRTDKRFPEENHHCALRTALQVYREQKLPKSLCGTIFPRLIQDRDDFVNIHCETPLTTIPGFNPWRFLDASKLVGVAECEYMSGSQSVSIIAGIFPTLYPYKVYMEIFST